MLCRAWGSVTDIALHPTKDMMATSSGSSSLSYCGSAARMHGQEMEEPAAEHGL